MSVPTLSSGLTPSCRSFPPGVLLLLGLSGALPGPLTAQNLVLNPGFEDHSGCPNNVDQLERADHWSRTTDGTSDYFHTCTTGVAGAPANAFGYAAPFEGAAYAGFATYVDPATNPAFADYREYLTGRLAEPLEADREYRVSFLVSLAEGFKYATSQIGVCFTAGDPQLPSTGTNYPALSVSPHDLVPQIEYDGAPIADTAGWTVIEGVFTAAGGERFLTLGNFRPDAGTDTAFVSWMPADLAYYYVDAVWVAPRLSAPLAADDTISTWIETPVWIPVLDNDYDPSGPLDPATLQIVAAPSWGAANPDPSGEVYYEPDPGFTGVDAFLYRICNGGGLCDTAAVRVTVRPSQDEPDPPVAVNDTVFAEMGEVVIIEVMYNDQAGDAPIEGPSLTITDPPALGTAITYGEAVRYEAVSPGLDRFEYRICDGNGLCDQAWVVVSTAMAPHTLCLDDTAWLDETAGQGVIIEVLANDLPGSGDFDPASLEILAGPAAGVAEIEPSGAIRYIRTAPAEVDAVVYRACDENASCGTATLLLRGASAPNDPFNGLYIPTVITPDGDGYNDALVISGLEAWADHELVVFNRWGQLLYRSTAYSQDWSGDRLPATTYFVVLRLQSEDLAWTYAGHLLVLR